MTKKESKPKKPTAKKEPKSRKKESGRPTDYTVEYGEHICNIIATHPIGYPSIRAIYPELPAPCTVRDWRRKYPEFSTKYLEAKQFQAECLVEEIDELLPSDVKTYIDERGNERYDSPSISAVIAKINNRKWMAARLSPRIYGDHKQIEALEGENEALRNELMELRNELNEKHKKDY